MKIWEADEESLDLMEAAAEMAIAAEAARARRADPDGIISRSHNMSKFKLQRALVELRAPHCKEWLDFTDAEKARWFEALEIFQAQSDDGLRSAAFKRLRHFGLCRHSDQEAVPYQPQAAPRSEEVGTNAKLAEVLESGKRVL